MFTYILYVLADTVLAISFFKDRNKTKLALGILSPETITKLPGTRSGIWGVLGASVIGSVP